MHSLHRDLQAKYDRSLDDIYHVTNEKNELKEKCAKLEAELVNLRSIKIENDAKIAYMDERIRSLNKECDLKAVAYNELEKKMTKAQEIIEEKNLLIKETEQKLNQHVHRMESEKALINGLKSEKTHLELALKENIIMRTQYQKKSETL